MLLEKCNSVHVMCDFFSSTSYEHPRKFAGVEWNLKAACQQQQYTISYLSVCSHLLAMTGAAVRLLSIASFGYGILLRQVLKVTCNSPCAIVAFMASSFLAAVAILASHVERNANKEGVGFFEDAKEPTSLAQ
jgi:hypothetical protein